MKFHPTLKKSIAFGLAAAMFSMPLAGCGFLSENETSSDQIAEDAMSLGMSVFFGPLFLPIWADIFDGGDENLPEGAIVVKLPRANDMRLVTEGITMDAVRYYVRARIYTEILARANETNMTPKEYAKLLKDTAALWQCADASATLAISLAEALEKEEQKPGYKPLAMVPQPVFGARSLFSVAHAAEDKTQYERGTKEWAQEITRMYESYPAGKGMHGLALALKTDARSANEQFQEAVKILDTDKVFGIDTGIRSERAAELYDTGVKTAIGVKISCQVALVAGTTALSLPTIAAGGVAGTFAGVNGIVSTADCVLCWQNGISEIQTGEVDPVKEKVQRWTGAISAVTSLGTMITSFQNFALKGPEAVRRTQESLEAVGLNSSGFLDAHQIGGGGVATILDSTSWMVDRGLELQEGKLMGFDITTTKKGDAAIIPKEVSEDSVQPPQPIEKVSDQLLFAYLKIMNMTGNLSDREYEKIRAAYQAALEEAQKAQKELSEEGDQPPKPIDTVPDDVLSRWVADLKEQYSDIQDYTEKMMAVFQAMQEEAQKAQEEAQNAQTEQGEVQTAQQQESRTRQEKEDNNAPYAPAKLAGTYVMKGVSDIAAEFDVTATAEVSARADGSLLLTYDDSIMDDGSEIETITAWIDPQTGSGSTEDGEPLTFQVSGGSYVATFENYAGQWRGYKQ